MRGPSLLVALALGACGHDKQQDAPAKAEAIDAATALDPRLRLVAVDVASTLDVAAPIFVVIAADGTITHATRVAAEVSLASLPAGTPAKVEELRAIVEAARPAPSPDDPCTQGILGNPQLIDRGDISDGYAGNAWQALGLGPTPAGLRGIALTTPSCNLGVPLVLADERAPATRLLEVLSALPSSSLGVTTDGGQHARTLGFELTYAKGNTPAPHERVELGITLRPDGTRASTFRGRIADEQTWMWRGDVSNIADAYHQGAARDPMLGFTEVRLRIDGEVTAGALITAIANLLAGHVVTIAFGEPIDAEVVATLGPAVGTPSPRITIGTPKVRGGFDPAVLRRYVRRAIDQGRGCYEHDLPVKVTAKLAIDGTGRVTSASVTGADPHVEACLGAVIAQMVLPRSPDAEPSQATVSIDLTPSAP